MNSVIIMIYWKVFDNTHFLLTAKYIFDFVTLAECFDMLCFIHLTCSHWLLLLAFALRRDTFSPAANLKFATLRNFYDNSDSKIYLNVMKTQSPSAKLCSTLACAICPDDRFFQIYVAARKTEPSFF